MMWSAQPNLFPSWRIEAPADLQTWQKLETLTNTQATFQFKDTTANGMDPRFYRVFAE